MKNDRTETVKDAAENLFWKRFQRIASGKTGKKHVVITEYEDLRDTPVTALRKALEHYEYIDDRVKNAMSDPGYWLYQAEKGLVTAMVATFTYQLRNGTPPRNPPAIEDNRVLMDKIADLDTWSQEVLNVSSTDTVITEGRTELRTHS